MKDQGNLTPGKIASLQPDSKLNIVFDIDHTLIFAIEKRVFPRLDEQQIEGYAEIKSIKIGK